MVEKLDWSELVNFKEFLLANSIQVDASTQLLIKKGIITNDEFFTKLKQMQMDYQTLKLSCDFLLFSLLPNLANMQNFTQNYGIYFTIFWTVHLSIELTTWNLRKRQNRLILHDFCVDI